MVFYVAVGVAALTLLLMGIARAQLAAALAVGVVLVAAWTVFASVNIANWLIENRRPDAPNIRLLVHFVDAIQFAIAMALAYLVGRRISPDETDQDAAT